MAKTGPGPGRPTKYRQEMGDRVIEMMREGASKLEVCADLDISYDTFLAYQERHPEFLESVKRGEDLSEAWWTHLGRMGATGEMPNANATFFVFNMKNRFNWSDRRDVHQTGDVSIHVTTGIDRAPGDD